MNREKIILDNRKLISFIINKHYYSKIELYDDLFQEGLIGLINATDRYGDSPNFRNIAYTSIKNNISDYLKKLAKFPTNIDIYDEKINNAYSDYLSYDIDLSRNLELENIRKKLSDKEFDFIVQLIKGNTFRSAVEKIGFKKSYSSVMIKNVKRKLNIK